MKKRAKQITRSLLLFIFLTGLFFASYTWPETKDYMAIAIGAVVTLLAIFVLGGAIGVQALNESIHINHDID